MRLVNLSALLLCVIALASCEDSTKPSKDAARGTDLKDQPDTSLDLSATTPDRPGSREVSSLGDAQRSERSSAFDLPIQTEAMPADLPSIVEHGLPAACHDFVAFNCSTTDPFVLCNSTCTDTGVIYKVFCTSGSNKCSCSKGNNVTNTCPLVGTLCDACENAFRTCCKF